MEMTKQVLLDICKQHKLYRSAELNDKLYCNFKGFTRIENLEEYSNLKAIFLESNALESLDGLQNLRELRCLYVQNNCIWRISGLESLQHLDTLNISSNQLTKLENLSCCPELKTLLATHNRLESLESVQHLAQCTTLQTLDLQENHLKDPAVVDVFTSLPNLRCLYLKGNPVVSAVKNYRKTLIARIPSLTYLDDRPVFEIERRCAEAWLAGGLDAERAERLRCKEEEREADRRNFEALQQIRKEGFRKRRKALGLPDGDTDPAFDNMSDTEWEPAEEPAELVEARKRLAAFTPNEGIEEPADIRAARQQLVKQGGTVAAGNWGSSEQDGQVYLNSIKENQRELARAGGAAVAAAASAAQSHRALEGDDVSGHDQAGLAQTGADEQQQQQQPAERQLLQPQPQPQLQSEHDSSESEAVEEVDAGISAGSAASMPLASQGINAGMLANFHSDMPACQQLDSVATAAEAATAAGGDGDFALATQESSGVPGPAASLGINGGMMPVLKPDVVAAPAPEGSVLHLADIQLNERQQISDASYLDDLD